MNAETRQAELVNRAREMYANDSLEVDQDAQVSVSSEGSWVQAWVWVPAEDGQENPAE
jgi:hypothetical protein